MHSRWLLNLGLLALVAILSLVVVQLHDVSKDTLQQPLTALRAGEIERLRIVYPNDKPVVLTKRAGRWWLEAPVHARANQAKLRNLAALAAATTELRLPADSDNLRKFGLNPPKARLWLNDKEVAVGIQHPFKNARYVFYHDSVYLIPAHHFAPAAYRYRELIDTKLLDDERTPSALKLPALSLRQQNGAWVLEPPNETITPDQINAFIDNWRFARAFAVQPYSGGEARGSILLTFTQGAAEKKKLETLELGILSYKPELVLYRQDEGLEYRFTEDVAKRLLRLTLTKPPDDK
ncbi:MAG: DUF4340 domain-containing protein [Acidiferrobacterales bacterium]